ncbi:T9SS type A sorting domain-containing protein [Candidatus Poribacteria bacterium]|nr:T9SS type A sorting domain-containing protein [Candidatus Poribacteria bacterium]
MRFLIILSAIIVIAILVLVPGVGMAQINWEKYPANPVIDLGAAGSWDDVHVSNPSVLFDGSKYHIWYVGDNGSQRSIGYARSTDGTVWEKYPGNPVLQDGLGDVWDGDFVSQPTVLYDGAQYRMWYAGYDGSKMRIGYATSGDGLVWNKHPSNPVLDLGENGSWDAMGVSSPTVLYDDVGYRMWYVGYDGSKMRIGYATSGDGLVWNKHPSNPVVDLGGSGSWDANGVSAPTVVFKNGTYRMWYTGYDGGNLRIGYATSGDGLVWSKHPSNPVVDLGESGSWDAKGVSAPTVVVMGGTYWMCYTGYDGANMRIGFGECKLSIGDVSGDGTVSAYDASLILQFVVGLIDKLPFELLNSPIISGLEPRTYQVSIPSLSVKEGDMISAPIVVSDGTNMNVCRYITSGGISLLYDASVLKPVKVSASPLISDYYLKYNINKPGEIRIAFVGTKLTESVGLSPLMTQPPCPPLLRGKGARGLSPQEQERLDSRDVAKQDMLYIEFEALPFTSEVRKFNFRSPNSPLILNTVELSGSSDIIKRHGFVEVLPSRTELLPNYPNPFNPETWIPYRLSEGADVTVYIYDNRGQLARSFFLGTKPAGTYLDRGKAVYWDGRNDAGDRVASGVYFYQLKAGRFSDTRKLAVMK